MQLYKRKQVTELVQKLNEERRTIIAVTGPRQVGKTTIVKQATEELGVPVVYRTADGTMSSFVGRLSEAWTEARAIAVQSGAKVILVLDEIQKVPDWSNQVKKYWDEDTWNRLDIRVIVLGSSIVLLNDGLRESLAGRFERIRVMPWTYSEMQVAFGWDIEQFISFGGYPGAAPYVNDIGRWMSFMLDSIIEPVVLKDILDFNRIDKPLLLRDTLRTAARLSGREISLTKFLAELPDAGNTSTIVSYLDLLERTGLLCGLQKYTRALMKRRSAPKMQVFANATATACGSGWRPGMSNDVRGRCVDSCVGAYLRSAIEGTDYSLSWWREGYDEVDYVLHSSTRCVAIEVATAPAHHRHGLAAFVQRFPDATGILVGGDGIPLELFLSLSPGEIGR